MNRVQRPAAALVGMLGMLAGCSAVTGAPVASPSTVASPSRVASPSTAGPTQTPASAAVVTVSAADSPAPQAAAQVLSRAGFPVLGTALAARQWRDRNGLNLMVASQTVDHRRADDREPDVETLHVLLVGDLAGRPRLLRAVRDPSGRPCPLEFGQGIAEGSIRVTDTDHDGVGEVSVGWFDSCRSDVGQYPVKLALLTGSTKLILRGQGIAARGRASIPEAELAGYGLPPASFTPEPSGEQWPPGTYDDTVHLFHAVFR